MKILVVSQYYYPEPFRITDICEALVSAGHSVTVITATPNYPMGVVYEGYEKGKRSRENINGVDVRRIKTAPRKEGAISRAVNYFWFAESSKRYAKKLTQDYDVVFINQLSPVMSAKAGLAYKNKFGKKAVLYCLDLWPESLTVGGIKKGSFVYKFFGKISQKIYRDADKILITSQMFRDYLTDSFKIDDSKIEYLPQYSEDIFLSVKEKKQGDTFKLLFAGNIGVAQDLDTVIDVARALKDENIEFNIVGDGTELERIKKKAENLSNVVFYGRCPLSDMPSFYEEADACIVTLTNDGAIGHTLPGKVQSCMAAGRPIVAAAGGETALLLNDVQGGYCSPSGDANGLAQDILNLKNGGQAAELGKRNREYYVEHFTKDKFMKKLSKSLEENI